MSRSTDRNGGSVEGVSKRAPEGAGAEARVRGKGICIRGWLELNRKPFGKEDQGRQGKFLVLLLSFDKGARSASKFCKSQIHKFFCRLKNFLGLRKKNC
jgi:hypothetical protein